MPTKVVILAQFDHGYYIRGTLKRLTDVADWPKAWWICFDHGYYIRGTLKWLADVFSWLKAWWIRLSVKQVTDQKSMPLLDHWRGNAWKRYDIHGTLKWLTGALAWLKAWWICTRNPCCCCIAREEMATKVVILAQFDHGYYIRGTLKWLADVFVRFLAWWIRFGHGYYIRGTLKRLTGLLAWPKAWWICLSVKQVKDSKSMPLLPQWRRNAHKSHAFGSV
ncbi:hypothetical protein C8R44DRAFT_725409 [Mycena epipterygia]|nr:hypothetical protein C8R44DRAFT_725409 [Mycena epipterygia]